MSCLIVLDGKREEAGSQVSNQRARLQPGEELSLLELSRSEVCGMRSGERKRYDDAHRSGSEDSMLVLTLKRETIVMGQN